MNENMVIALAAEEPQILAELKSLFTKIGFNVSITAGSGEALLEQLLSTSTMPNVCMISKSMLTNGGLQLVAEIKSKWQSMKIIITSFSGSFISKLQNYESLNEQFRHDLTVAQSLGRATVITKRR